MDAKRKNKIRESMYVYKYMLKDYPFHEYAETVLDDIERELKDEEDGEV